MMLPVLSGTSNMACCAIQVLYSTRKDYLKDISEANTCFLYKLSTTFRSKYEQQKGGQL